MQNIHIEKIKVANRQQFWCLFIDEFSSPETDVQMSFSDVKLCDVRVS